MSSQTLETDSIETSSTLRGESGPFSKQEAKEATGDDEWYLEDGNVTLLVEDKLFKV